MNAHRDSNSVQTRKHCDASEETLEEQRAVDTKNG